MRINCLFNIKVANSTPHHMSCFICGLASCKGIFEQAMCILLWCQALIHRLCLVLQACFRFGWFWFCYFSVFILLFLSPPPATISRSEFCWDLVLIKKKPCSKSLSGICNWKFGFLVKAFPYLPKSKLALEITSDSQSFLLSLVQTHCGF